MIEAIELTSSRRSRHTGAGPVENVSFDVYPGQVTALLGASGSGKSTVLRLMTELEPGGGRTLFGGRPYRALRPAVREVGLALNPDAVHPGRTVQAHLQLYAAAGGVAKPRIAEVLEVAGLSTQATVRCGRLDPGQRQRLSIAAALIGDPAALILDEPHALDTHGMSWFHALIRAYAAQGRTVLVAATDPDVLAGTADHVVVLRRDENDGISRVIASRSAAEVFDERRATVVQVRSPQAARLAAALEAEGANLAPAGPGALQVRGLDRARIGEVAHVAGVCLHELSEIGHDDDIFGLRPAPRQKELLPGLNRVSTPWNSGVRMVAEHIEEAEVVEAAEEASAEAEQPATMSFGARSRIEQQIKGPGEVDATLSQEPVAEAAEVAEAAQPAAKPSTIGSWRTQGSVAGSRWSAVKGSQQQGAGGRLTGGMASDGGEVAAGTPVPFAYAASADAPAAAESIATASDNPAPSAAAPTAASASGPAAAVVSRTDAWAAAVSNAAASSAAVPTVASAPGLTAAPTVATSVTSGIAAPAAPGAPGLTAAASTAAPVPVSAAHLDSAAPGAVTPAAERIRFSTAAASSAAAPTAASTPASSADTLTAPAWNPAASNTGGLSALAASAAAASAAPAWSPTASGTGVASAPVSNASAALTAPAWSAAGPTTAAASASAPSAASAAAPAKPREVHRRTAFGLRWGRGKAQPPAQPPSETASVAAPVLTQQPAVPFTVALPAAEQDAAAEGMTPWRAVAARGSQHGSQSASVADAAPGEQEGSA